MEQNLKFYFDEHAGLGVLSTADREGRVNSAVYARPHVLDEQTLVLIMASHRSRNNVRENPHAAYLFREEGPGYRGVRLNLERIAEEQDPQRVDEFRRRVAPATADSYREQCLSLVTFRIVEVRPLVGDGREA